MGKWLSALVCAAWLVSGCGDSESSVLMADAAVGEGCGIAGKTLACVGPGGCRGGQVCRADGTYSDCDCDAPAAAECGAAGVVVTCIGPGNCLGAAACQPDGTYTACQCLPPAQVPDSGTPDLAITIAAPKKDAVLSGTVVVKGTAGEDTLAVGVSLGGDPFVTAKGTTAWTRSIDTTKLADGPATLVVAARSVTGLENVVALPVEIDNSDNIVGIWQSALNVECTLYFFASGTFVDTCRYFSYGPNRWQRESDSLLTISNSGSWPQVIAPTFSSDGKRLTLEVDGIIYTFKRVKSVSPAPVDDAGVDDAG